MQFYVVLPVVLWFFKDKLQVLLPIIIICTTAFSTYNLYVLDNKSAMYFSLVARIPEFLIGAYFAILFKDGLNYRRFINNIVASASLIILLLCAWFITDESYYPGYLALIPCTASATLLALKNNVVSDFFAGKIPVYIGEMSYSLYLWHWPIIAFIRYKNDGFPPDIYEIIFILVLTYICAWLSYNFIEKAFKKHKDQYAFLRLAIGVVSLALFYPFIPLIAEKGKMADIYTRPIMGLKSNGNDSVEKFGDLNRNDSIVLIGDSHALMLKPFLDKIGRENGFSFYTLTTSSFPPISGIKRTEIRSSKMKYFDSSVKLIPKTDSLIKNNKIIILNIFGLRDDFPSLENAVRSLATNVRSNQSLVLIGTFPTVSKNPLKKNNAVFRINDSHNPIKKNMTSRNKLKNIASTYPNVYYFDISQSKIFEDAPYINDTVAYYDAEHINHYGSLKLADDIGLEFYRFLQGIGN